MKTAKPLVYGTPYSKGFTFAGGIRSIRFDATIVRGRIEFPFPIRTVPTRVLPS